MQIDVQTVSQAHQNNTQTEIGAITSSWLLDIVKSILSKERNMTHTALFDSRYTFC